MDNPRDEQDHPAVCPICDRSVKPSGITERVRDVTVHPDCLAKSLRAHRDRGETDAA